jgi:uncharacterized protein (DUF433 family)
MTENAHIPGIDWSIDWREWAGIEEPAGAALIDWSRCPDAESVPDRCSGAWVVKNTRVMVRGILDNAEAGCSAEEIARDIFPSVTAEQVRRMLRFAYRAQIEAVYDQRRTPLFPRDYELEGVILPHKLAGLNKEGSQGEGYATHHYE